MAALDALVLGPSTPTGTLALHGGGGGPEANFPFLPALAETGRVVAPYWPGVGPSPRSSTPLCLDDLADRSVAAADDAGLERFDLLGFSLGVAVAVRVAVRHPDRVRRLVLTAGFAHPSPSLRLAVALWRDLLAGDAVTLGRFLAWVSSSEGAWRTDDDPEAVARAVADAVPPGTPEHVALIEGIDVRTDLADVAAPTLVVAPSQDRLLHPAHSAELAAGIAGARLVEIHSGHVVAAEAPDAWWELVAAHLGRDDDTR